MSTTQRSLLHLLRTSWSDWSGFLKFVFQLGLAAGAWFGASFMADWATDRVFEGAGSGFGVVLSAKAMTGFVFASLLLAADVLLGCVRTSFPSMLAAWVVLFTLGYTLSGWQRLDKQLQGPLFWVNIAVVVLGFLVGWTMKPWKYFWPLEEPEEWDHA